jgi:hypothetical protein
MEQTSGRCKPVRQVRASHPAQLAAASQMLAGMGVLDRET